MGMCRGDDATVAPSSSEPDVALRTLSWLRDSQGIRMRWPGRSTFIVADFLGLRWGRRSAVLISFCWG